jgi:hypothetical protein
MLDAEERAGRRQATLFLLVNATLIGCSAAAPRTSSWLYYLLEASAAWAFVGASLALAAIAGMRVDGAIKRWRRNGWHQELMAVPGAPLPLYPRVVHAACRPWCEKLPAIIASGAIAWMVGFIAGLTIRGGPATGPSGPRPPWILAVIAALLVALAGAMIAVALGRYVAGIAIAGASRLKRYAEIAFQDAADVETAALPLDLDLLWDRAETLKATPYAASAAGGTLLRLAGSLLLSAMLIGGLAFPAWLYLASGLSLANGATPEKVIATYLFSVFGLPVAAALLVRFLKRSLFPKRRRPLPDELSPKKATRMNRLEMEDILRAAREKPPTSN